MTHEEQYATWTDDDQADETRRHLRDTSDNKVVQDVSDMVKLYGFNRIKDALSNLEATGNDTTDLIADEHIPF